MQGQVLFIESNLAGNAVPAIRRAKELGYLAHFVAASPAEYAEMDSDILGAADVVTQVNTTDIGGLLHLVESQAIPVRTAVAFDDYRVVAAAAVRDHLGGEAGLPGVLATRFKDLFRDRLADSPFAVRRQRVGLSDSSEAPFLPCVVKPCDDSGSVNVRLCHSAEEYAQALKAIRSAAGQPNGRGYLRGADALVEEFLDGDEFSAEMVWDESCLRWLAVCVVRKLVLGGGSFIEMGHLTPWDLGPEHVKVTDQIDWILRYVGLRKGVCHVEFKLTTNGVRVVEVNPRPAGGPIGRIVRAALNVELPVLHLESLLGETIDSKQWTTGLFAGAVVLCPAGATRLAEFRCVEDDRWVVRAPSVPIEMADPRDNDARIGDITATAASMNEVGDMVVEAFRGIETDPAGALLDPVLLLEAALSREGTTNDVCR